MLAQHLHDSTVRRDVVVYRKGLADKAAILGREDIAQPVRRGFVGTVQTEISLLRVAREGVAEQLTQRTSILLLGGARSLDFYRVLAEVGQVECDGELAAVGVRIRAHSTFAFGREGGQLSDESAIRIEEVFRLIAAHPALQLRKVVGICAHFRQRYLVRAKRSFDWLAIYHLRPGPAFRRAERDCRPARTAGHAVGAGVILNITNALVAGVKSRREGLVELCWVIAFDKMYCVAISFEERPYIVIARPGQHRRAADFVAVEMQNGKYRTIAGWIEEACPLPGAGQRACFRLAVTNHRHY